MRYLVKFFLVFLFLFFVCYSSVYAVDINMNIGNTVQDENTVNQLSNNELANNNFSNSSSSTKVSTTETSEDFALSVSDIINIILIAVGIVIIFLAIAILLKIK